MLGSVERDLSRLIVINEHEEYERDESRSTSYFLDNPKLRPRAVIVDVLFLLWCELIDF